MGTAPKDATHHTRSANAPRELGFDPDDFERASRGLIAEHPTGVIETPMGVVFDVNRYDFVERGSVNPDTVHPSLWRQAQLNGIHGLFEVAPGVWQARGYDISNVTFIAGETGWLVIDPLTVEPCAKACLDLANAHLGERPVVAVIYTHSHTDHFGGVLGVTTQEDVDAGRCRIIAPEHFLKETIGENVIAGYAMTRRAMYQFGPLLPAGPKTHVDCGLGKAIPFWPPGLIAPTEEITATGTELIVDGVRIQFQLTPETEAPAEMNFFFPDHGWLCTAENCTHTMHNLVPIRGALVRDSLKWSKYIGEMIELYGPNIELMFASHNWPRWGNENVLTYLRLQRDLYRWIHDQTMRFANQGYNAAEIAEMLTMPPEFAAEAHTTGYYGHLVHNIKAVFQRYLSWYDGNPANLWKLPPVEGGRRYVELAGGPDQLLAKARASVRCGRVPVGRRARQPSRLRRSHEPGGPRTAGRHARAARLPVRVGDLPKCVPHRRPGAAQRHAAVTPRGTERLPRCHDDRSDLRQPGREAEGGGGRRAERRGELHVHRSRRTVGPAPLAPDPARGRQPPRRRCRGHVPAAQGDPAPGGRRDGHVRRRDRRRRGIRRGRRRCVRCDLRTSRRVHEHVRARGAVAGTTTRTARSAG